MGLFSEEDAHTLNLLACLKGDKALILPSRKDQLPKELSFLAPSSITYPHTYLPVQANGLLVIDVLHEGDPRLHLTTEVRSHACNVVL